MEYPRDEIRITFTAREIEVLRSVMTGLANRERAETSAQVEAHLEPIMDKLFLQNGSQESRNARERKGLIKSDGSFTQGLIDIFRWPVFAFKRISNVLTGGGRLQSDGERMRQKENIGKHLDFTFIITRDDLRELL